MPENYTGDEGTVAFAAGLDILDGTEDRRTGWLAINKTRDYLVTWFGNIWSGVRGVTTAAQVRANLGIPDIAAPDSAEPGEIPIYNAAGQLTSFPPTLGAHVATKAYADSKGQLIDGGTYLRADGKNLGTTGDLFADGTVIVSGATPATSGYTVAYINFDGKLSKGASSARYKQNIQDAPDLGDIWPVLREFQMIGGDGDPKIGYIAEELVGTPAERFIVWTDIEGDRVPDSIDFIALLLAQNAQLHRDLDLLAQRLDER